MVGELIRKVGKLSSVAEYPAGDGCNVDGDGVKGR